MDPTTPYAQVLEERGTAEHLASRTIVQLDELLGSRAGSVTLAEAAVEFTTSELTPQVVGTGREVAEQLAEIFTSGAADGFLVTPTHFPGTFDEFGRAVVPHLQRLGVFRTEYDGTTLRSHLGLR